MLRRGTDSNARRLAAATVVGLLYAAAITFAAMPAQHGAPRTDAVPGENPYAPYRFLIGEWDVAPEGGGPAIGVARFRWGPNQSYVWLSMSLVSGAAEAPHFEGLLVYNAVNRNLDMLVCGDLEHGLMQEKGTFSMLPDGSAVREITATFASGGKGATASFRQPYRPVSADRIHTSAMRQTASGWVPTFPGSDRLVMTRRRA
jgi:hypothetical protein